MKVPTIPDEIVNKAVLARGHGHQADDQDQVGVGIAMRRALEAVYPDLVVLWEDGKQIPMGNGNYRGPGAWGLIVWCWYRTRNGLRGWWKRHRYPL